MKRLAPWTGLAAGLALLLAALFPGSDNARAASGTDEGQYVVVRHVLFAGTPIGVPEGDDSEAVSAQFKVNDHRWIPASLPVSVGFNPAGAPDGLDAVPLLLHAIEQWNGVAPDVFAFEWKGSSTGSTGACETNTQRDGINTVKFVDYLPFGVLGQTCSVWSISGGKNVPLVEFDMELTTKMQWSTADETPPGHYDLWSTVLHEMGHAAGLGHTEDGGAVMYATLRSGQQRRLLADDDKQGLLTAYPQAAATATPSPSPTAPPTLTPTPVPAFSRDFAIVTANLARD